MKKIFIVVYLLTVSIILTAQIQQLTKLVAADRAEGNQLGTAIAISGNYAVVGAADISEGNIPNSGQCAYVFEHSADGNWKQIQKLVASDQAGGDNFGHSVSINGNYILIGAPGKDNSTGAAYIFKHNSSGNWIEEKKIVAADRNVGDLFGTSVSITSVYGRGDESYVLIGAPGDADYGTMPKLAGAGTAYFFTNLSGTWEVLHKTGPDISDRSANAGFGTSVAISSASAVIGAPYEKKDTTGSNPLDAAGAAYVFQRTSGAFELNHKIVNWDRASGDQFGYSVAINGKTIMVGAPFEDENNSTRYTTLLSAGSVYVYEKKSDDNWHWIDKLTPTDRAAGDNFGHSVSLSGNTAVIGAVAADEALNSLSSTGAAYIFLYDGNLQGWATKQIKIVATDRAANDWFGYSVAVDNNNILVGAPFQDRNQTRIMATDAGAAYIFGQTSCMSSSSSISPIACKTYTSPSKKYSLTSSGTYLDTVLNKAGCDSIISINLSITGKADTSVTVKGNTLTANALNASYQWIDCNTNQPININTRSLIATVNGSYKVSIDQDGCTGVSSCYTIKPNPPIDKQPLVPPVNTNPTSNSQLKEFVEINKLVPKDRGGYENFGYSVGISGEYAVIGANVDDKDASGNNAVNDAGSAYIFKKEKDGKWKQVQKIVASDRKAGDNFGWSVAISLNHIVVGAPYHNYNPSGTHHGAAYIFERNDEGVWIQKQKLIASPIESQILFGSSVAIDGITIAVGCPAYAKDSSGKPETNITAAGAIFVFDKSGGAWIQSQLITVNNRSINNLGDDLGNSVSICGDLIIAGAWGADFNASGGQKMEAAGAAYIFERTGGKWKQVQKIVPADRAPYDEFGVTVAISGDNAIIGARRKTETNDPNSRAYTGNAYIFSRKQTPGNVRPDGGVILTPDDGKWKQVLKINPEDRRPDDYLGWSVGISGDYAIVSAMKQDTDSLDNRIPDGGAIYVFYQDKNSRWSQVGKLATFDRSQLDNFGYAVAISGCDIIGGTIVDQEDDKDANALTSAGSAYIFSAADCRNMAPCYRANVTPDIKTPRDKTDQSKNIINNSNSATNNTSKKSKPEKAQSADLNGKGNEINIENVELVNKEPGSYDFSNVKICVDIIKENLSLPPRTRDPFYYYIPQINPDGTLKDVGVIKQELVGYTEKMWSTGETIKVGFFNDAGATTNIIDKIKKYATEWEKYTNVKFEFVDAVGKAQIKIGFADKGKAWSWYGRDILINPFGVATMNFGWFNSQTTDKEFRVTIQHEFGHALGFVHEHQSPAAGINWDKEKVYALFAKDPPKWTRAEVDENIFKMYNKTSLNYSAYDPFSIMHYIFPAGLTTDGTAFPDIDFISGTDMQYAKLFYPFAPVGKNATGILRTTDDCDEIDFSVEYNVVDTTIIEFTLEPGKDHNNKLVSWWKRIGVPSKGGVYIDLEIENGSIANKKIPVLMIDNNRGIAFSKAKLLGIHTLLNYKWNVMPALRGGCRVKLTWRRDTCL